jgi:tetratricopeptide (TPR) repeat protein
MLSVIWATATATAQQSPSIYQQAAQYIQQRESSSAITLLEPRLKEAPQDLKALTLMGMALAAENRHAEAGGFFRKALAIDPRFAPAVKNLAISEMAAGETASAKNHFKQLLQLIPADPIAHLALADVEFASRNYRVAVSHYEQSANLYSRTSASILNYAQALIEVKETAKAAQILEQVPAGANSAEHFNAGTLLARIERYDAAAREFERARGPGADEYAVGYNLTLAYVKAGQHVAAARIAEDLIARGYRKSELYDLASQAYEGSGRLKEAYDALRTATNADPAEQINYIDLTALCIRHNNYNLALEIADLSIARIPNSERLHLQRGIVLAMKEDFGGARTEFETAVKLAPEKGLPYAALGLILMQMDQAQDAVKVLRDRVRAAPSDYIALWFLGEALNRSGAAAGSAEDDEARRALSRSVELNPQVAQSRILLAKLLARRGELDAAVQHLNRALELDPENITATYQLAQVLQKKGDTARAKQLFAKVSKAKAEDREQFTRGGLQHIIRAESQ